MARKNYLFTQWTKFLQGMQHQSPGTLTSFIGHLQRSEVESVFVPKKLFRQLSPENPYAAKSVEGHYEEVRPSAISLSLITCREQLAEYWVELMPSLSSQTGTPEAWNATRLVEHTNASLAYDAYDKQLLLGIATKLAARQMLHELSLRPSCAHLHDWLADWVFVQHAEDLTGRGSVEALHAKLVTQPIVIRGGAIVDPADISLELFQRSVDILELIESDLRAAPEHIVPLTADFFEACLRQSS